MPIAGFGSSDCATCRSHLLEWSNGGERKVERFGWTFAPGDS
jgi:Uri superfamily endonuclease